MKVLIKFIKIVGESARTVWFHEHRKFSSPSSPAAITQKMAQNTAVREQVDLLTKDLEKRR